MVVKKFNSFLLESKKLDDVVLHLKGRGIDPDKTRVIIDEKSGDSFFFLYNLSGQLVGYHKYNKDYPKNVKGVDAKMQRYYTWVSDEGAGKKIAVWGLETIKQDDKFFFVTEGVFDIARVHEAGYPGIAVLCNDPSPSLLSWIRTLPHKKIVIYDNDQAGKKLKKISTHSFTVPDSSDYKDLNDMSPKEAKDLLDAIVDIVGFD